MKSFLVGNGNGNPLVNRTIVQSLEAIFERDATILIFQSSRLKRNARVPIMGYKITDDSTA